MSLLASTIEVRRWDVAELASWNWAGLIQGQDEAGERARYNGGAFFTGILRGPHLEVPPFEEAVASWSAYTAVGTWLEPRLRARLGGAWTAWYSLGVWADTSDFIARHSVAGQSTEHGEVEVDVLRLRRPADAYQVELGLFTMRPEALPEVHSLTVVTSPGAAAPDELEPGDPSRWGRVLGVPPRFQMAHGGGEAWCSPTAVAMVLAYWGREVAVTEAAGATYDRVYGGCGNWSFNVAYAARSGVVAYVSRLDSFRELERWIAAGVPVVISYRWQQGELTGAPLPTSDGHLAVVAGFDEQGDPVVNDPAAPSEESVRRTYDRRQLERLWLTHSAGTVYLIYPPGFHVPR